MSTSVQRVVFTSNLPEGHHPQYLNISIGFTVDITKARMIINRFPVALKQYVQSSIYHDKTQGT